MKKFRLEEYGSLLSNALILAVGIIFLINFSTAWTVIYILTIILLSISFLLESYNLITHKNKAPKISTVILLIADLLFVIFISINYKLFFNFIHIMVGWWIILNSCIAAINYYIYRTDNLKGTLFELFKCISGYIIGTILIIRPTDKLWILSLVTGIYLIIYAIFGIFGNIRDLLPNKQQKFINRHTSVALPVIINAIIPQQFYMSINSLIKNNKMSSSSSPVISDNHNLEVLIYLKEEGPESLGHVDICYKDYIYSYGCHDPQGRRLMGTLGDGVLIVSKRDSFIQQAISQDHKMVISYGLKLSNDELKIIEKRIDELLSRTVEWYCPARVAFDNHQDNTEINDYASRVYKYTNCKMYKFTKGKFKTYFVASTNCVLLADHLVRSKELNLVNVSGVVIPGTYIKFLNSEFVRGNSIVVSRQVYKD